MSANNAIPRRKFLSQAAAAAAVTIVPRHVSWARVRSASDKLNIAGIGVGGWGERILSISRRRISWLFAMLTGGYAERHSTAWIPT